MVPHLHDPFNRRPGKRKLGMPEAEKGVSRLWVFWVF